MRKKYKDILKQWTPPIVFDYGRKIAHSKLFADKQKKKEKKNNWYENYYSQFEFTQHYASSLYYFMYSILADRIVHKVSSILDIGCGSGYLASVLFQLNFTQYVGFDFSHKQLDAARKRCPEQKYYYADAYKTNLFYTVEYEAVACTEFLEHVEKDLDIIRRIPKGKIFFGSVPSFDFESHVRYFKTSGEVENRYAPLLKEFDINRYCLRNEENYLFIFEGITK